MISAPPRDLLDQQPQPEESLMSLPKVVSRDEWVAARKELLVKEKEMTRRRDALNTERRRLPMVRIEKDYVFEGPDGEASLLDLFEGRRQLIVGHFMFDPRWEDGCPSCSAGADAEAMDMAWEVFRAVLQGLALWWNEHPDVPRAQVVTTAMNALWIGFERVGRGERWEP